MEKLKFGQLKNNKNKYAKQKITDEKSQNIGKVLNYITKIYRSFAKFRYDNQNIISKVLN